MTKSNLGERVTARPASKYVGRDVTLTYFQYHASINSKRKHPPPPPGNFLKWSKALPRGKILQQKHGPSDTKNTYPREYFRRSSQPFLLIGVEILGNQNWKRIERLSNYSLVIPSSFSLNTILKVVKFSPSFEADFVTRQKQ